LGDIMSTSEAGTRNNWGRWSDADEIGALNLITPERVVDATGLVRRGQVVSLARVIRHDVVRTAERAGPTLFLTTDGGDYAAGAVGAGGAYFADDYLAMPVATGTHIDSLAHAWSDRGLYNGHDPNGVRSRGARHCGIDKVVGVVAGGVLADICALHGVECLPPSHVITPDELERMEPGIGMAAANWVAERDIAIVGADTIGVEVFPEEAPDVRSPVHVFLISGLGVHLVELLDLERLAPLAPGRFLFIAAPLRLRGAVNSPLNPLAVL
jgi:hypothetical protein